MDFNVRVNKNGEVDKNEAFKIEAVLPTIKFLLEKGQNNFNVAFGAAERQNSSELKLTRPPTIFQTLKKLVKNIGSGRRGGGKAVAKLKDGEILVLENTRFNKGEEGNDKNLPRTWQNWAILQ